MTSRPRSTAERTLATFDAASRTRWDALAERVRRLLPGRPFVDALPAEVAGWDDAARGRWLDAALAVDDAAAAVAIYRQLPAAVEGFGVHRAALLDLIARAAVEALPAEILTLVPLVSALVGAVPDDRRTHALVAAARVAAVMPALVPRLLRVLARVVGDADDAAVDRWVDRGLAIAIEYPEAARAYFAFESRTSHQVLRDVPTAARFDDARGVSERYVHMLSGRPAHARPDTTFRLRPPLEDTSDSAGMALPATIDAFGTVEDNTRLFRVTAALLAGRREFGTYAMPEVLDRVFAAPPEIAILECFLVADGYRVAKRLGARYPGIASDLAWATGHLLTRARTMGPADGATILDAVLAVALVEHRSPVSPWVAAPASMMLGPLRRLAQPDTTVADALAVAEEMAAALAAAADLGDQTLAVLAPEPAPESFYDLLYGDEPPELGRGEPSEGLPSEETGEPEDGPDVPSEPSDDDEPPIGGRAPSAEDLERLAKDGVQTQAGDGAMNPGAYVTSLLDKMIAARRAETALAQRSALTSSRARGAAEQAAVYLYDEWDHVIGDYRTAWCRLAELDVPDDAGVFYTAALDRHAGLVPELRRHFQRVRPEDYALLRGLEDGEEIDLVAAVDAHVDRRAGLAPSSKLYAARTRQRREVATLFLLDMSASTDETAATDDGERRIIDIMKESLVVMSTALEELGDTYAVYGFSGQGREQVEFYRVKAFDERLVPRRGRLGGIAPRGSTRMGTAVRHALTKLRRVRARARHLFLVSDGFPQDLDYGEERRSHVYGLRDTAMALREAEAEGVKPFFLTVDLAGHDYLKEMVDRERYCVIERVADLARELPRVYQRIVHAG